MAKKIIQKKAAIKEEEEVILYSIRRVKQLSCMINEFQAKDGTFEFLVNYNQKLGYNPVGFVDFILQASYVYAKYPDEPIASISVQTVFELSNLKRFIKPDNSLSLPRKFLATIVSISVSHTRALLAVQTAGTVYNEIILPIGNPYEMANVFFPEK